MESGAVCLTQLQIYCREAKFSVRSKYIMLNFYKNMLHINTLISKVFLKKAKGDA